MPVIAGRLVYSLLKFLIFLSTIGNAASMKHSRSPLNRVDFL